MLASALQPAPFVRSDRRHNLTPPDDRVPDPLLEAQRAGPVPVDGRALPVDRMLRRKKRRGDVSESRVGLAIHLALAHAHGGLINF